MKIFNRAFDGRIGLNLSSIKPTKKMGKVKAFKPGNTTMEIIKYFAKKAGGIVTVTPDGKT